MNYNNQDQTSLYNDDLNDNYLNNYTTIQPQIPTSTTFQPQAQMVSNVNTNDKLKLLENLSKDNIMNIPNNIDLNLLNGTALDDTEQPKIYSQKNFTEDNKSLIKSLTENIINNLKKNNLSLYDNNSINSRINNNYKNDINDSYTDKYEDANSFNSSNLLNVSKKNKKNKKNKDIINDTTNTDDMGDIIKKDDIKKTIENFVIKNENISTMGYVNWFFDDCFNYKDFLILFILYFVLSQEMIKDFFSKYFNSLNPDEEGKIGISGVIIYGLILTVLFMIIKKFV